MKNPEEQIAALKEDLEFTTREAIQAEENYQWAMEKLKTAKLDTLKYIRNIINGLIANEEGE